MTNVKEQWEAEMLTPAMRKEGHTTDPTRNLCASAPPDDDCAAMKARVAELEAEVRTMTTAGIIEVAVRNPSVMEYMRHWEARAEQAEARERALLASNNDTRSALVENASLRTRLKQAEAEVKRYQEKFRQVWRVAGVVETAINEPSRIFAVEPMEVRDYRHNLYPIWSTLVSILQRSDLEQIHAAQGRIAELEAEQETIKTAWLDVCARSGANAARAEQAEARVAELEGLAWIDGVPPKPWSSEWFIAETVGGDKVALFPLPEEWSYDFKNADETYFRASRIKRWMQFPDSEYVSFADARIAALTVRAERAEAALATAMEYYEAMEAFDDEKTTGNGARCIRARAAIRSMKGGAA